MLTSEPTIHFYLQSKRVQLNGESSEKMKRSGKNMKLNKEDFLVFRAIQYNTERATQRNTQQYKTEQYEAIYIYKYR